MSLKFENSRRDYESRPVCMDLKADFQLRVFLRTSTHVKLLILLFFKYFTNKLTNAY